MIEDFDSDKKSTPRRDPGVIDEVSEDDDSVSQASMISLTSLNQKFNFLMQHQNSSLLVTSGSGAILENTDVIVETLPPLP